MWQCVFHSSILDVELRRDLKVVYADGSFIVKVQKRKIAIRLLDVKPQCKVPRRVSVFSVIERVKAKSTDF